jgi:hypothetical protein
MKFDVFLCHNSEDKPAVIQIAKQLQAEKINPWLDIWHLRPGYSWQNSLEEQINTIGSAAIFIGGSGLGPWQNEEINALLRAFVKRKCPVIPILLPDAPQEPQLPLFLQGLMWVDFRQHDPQPYDPDPLEQLIWGITGVRREHNNLDFTRLRNLLEAQDWTEADKETYSLMIHAVGKKDGEWFEENELPNFPCSVLHTIDELWVKYSDGRFGFSIQKEIYMNLGGKTDGRHYEEPWREAAVRLGWLVNNELIYVQRIIRSIKCLDSTKFEVRGHFPLFCWWLNGMCYVDENGSLISIDRLSCLASRLKRCNH